MESKGLSKHRHVSSAGERKRVGNGVDECLWGIRASAFGLPIHKSRQEPKLVQRRRARKSLAQVRKPWVRVAEQMILSSRRRPACSEAERVKAKRAGSEWRCRVKLSFLAFVNAQLSAHASLLSQKRSQSFRFFRVCLFVRNSSYVCVCRLIRYHVQCKSANSANVQA